ncbi:MAG: transketolase [Spirochaetales bacterium]|nr:transketolase [Spirochaetales bacterium]
MRDRLASLLVEYAENDPNAYVLSGDHGYALFDPLRKSRPEKFVNVGIAEQGMIGYAAGMAKMGLRPIVYGLACFIPVRVVEFIKMDICYNSYPVVLLGDGAGLVYSTLGSSHQTGEDMAVLRSLPNLTIYSPADAEELEYSFRNAMNDIKRASYIRIGKSDRPIVHKNKLDLSNTSGFFSLRESASDITIISTGSMTSNAVTLAEKFDTNVISVVNINYFDKIELRKRIANKKLIVIEEHGRIGGLSSSVDQLLGETDEERKMLNLTLENVFTKYSSSYEVALKEHGMSFGQLEAKVFNWLNGFIH